MVPSLTAVDEQGTPLSPGLLYGDERGRTGVVSQAGTDDASGGFLGYVRWLHETVPTAHGFWPAQSVANHALAGEAVLDTTTASLAHPLFDFTGWDAGGRRRPRASRPSSSRASCPRAGSAGRSTATGPSLASGCIDAMAEQLVAGADQAGDVLVLLGTTLIVWVVAHEGARGARVRDHPAHRVGQLPRRWPEQRRRPVPRLGRRGSLAPATDRAARPGRGPGVGAVPARRARAAQRPHPRVRRCNDLDLTHDAAAVVRADRRGVGVRREARDRRRGRRTRACSRERIVASGGGTRVDEWVQAIADVTGLPVDCVAVPEGGALGSAWLARIAAGLEEPTAMTEGRRWARVGRRVEPRDVVDLGGGRTLRASSSRSAELPHEGGGSTTTLAREDEVHVARREPVAVGLAHAHPVGRDLGVARPRCAPERS